MKAVSGILPTLLEMIYFFSTPTIDVEPNETAELPGICHSEERSDVGIRNSKPEIC